LFQEEVGAVPEADSPDEEQSYAAAKDTEKLKMMLMAWNATGMPYDIFNNKVH